MDLSGPGGHTISDDPAEPSHGQAWSTLPNVTTQPPTRPSNVSRRTVVKGTAWAVPAVVVGTAGPALAASGCTVTAVLGRQSCVDTANNTAILIACFTSTCPEQVNMVLQSVQIGSSYTRVDTYYTLVQNREQCQQVTVSYNVPRGLTVNLNTVIFYPTGQRPQTFTVNTPTAACLVTE